MIVLDRAAISLFTSSRCLLLPHPTIRVESHDCPRTCGERAPRLQQTKFRLPLGYCTVAAGCCSQLLHPPGPFAAWPKDRAKPPSATTTRQPGSCPQTCHPPDRQEDEETEAPPSPDATWTRRPDRHATGHETRPSLQQARTARVVLHQSRRRRPSLEEHQLRQPRSKAEREPSRAARLAKPT